MKKIKLEENIEKVLNWFGITEAEKDSFLRQQFNIESINEFKNDDIKIEEFVNFFRINKKYLYDRSENLLLEKNSFYKRNESFCKEIIDNSPTKLYVITQRIPDKTIDEKKDNNSLVLIAEYEKTIFNGETIYLYEIFSVNGCRWGYWRCRWEFKKFLLCLKKNRLIDIIIGKTDKNIENNFYKFKKGEIKFIWNSSNWYPEDYIEFKYQNVKAKEEDELTKILKEFSSLKFKDINRNFLYHKSEIKLKEYLIKLYDIDEEKIKIEYAFDKYRADVVVFNNENQLEIIFEIKIGDNKGLLREKAKKQLLKYVSVFEKKPKYIVIAFPYYNDFDFYIYKKDDNYQTEISSLYIKTHNFKLVNKILEFLYANGKISKNETIENFYEILKKFLNNEIPFNVEEKIVYRYLYLIENLKTKNIIKEIINFDEVICNVGYICFKEEFLNFLSKKILSKDITFINFQPNFINLEFQKISIYNSKNNIWNKFFKLLYTDYKENYFFQNTIAIYNKNLPFYNRLGLKDCFILTYKGEYQSLFEKININKISEIYIFKIPISSNTNTNFIMFKYQPYKKDFDTVSLFEITNFSEKKSQKKEININEFNIHDYVIKNIFDCNCDKCIKLNGIKGEILNFEVIQGFMSIKQLKQLNISKLDIQRDIYKNHKNDLVEYFNQGKFQFIPSIIFGITESNRDKEYNMIKNLNNNYVEICLTENTQQHLKIIDGNHRFNALKEMKKENLLIGFTLIKFKEKEFAPIFYTLNSKMKPLNAKDYVNFIKNDYERKIGIINSLEDAGLIGLKNFNEIRKIINKNNLSKENDNEIEIFILKLAQYIEKHDLLENNVFLEELLSYAFEKYNLDIDVLRNIIQSVLKYANNQKIFKKEFDGFLEYIQLNSFENMIKNNDEIDLLYETYKKTYIPKSRKIYLSMPYHIHEELVYYIIKNDVEKIVSERIGDKVEIIRTDKSENITTQLIDDKIYNDIKKCDLMIADITGNNPNVYAEVGYKMALDKMNNINPRIIFIENTQGYYERVYKDEKQGKNINEIIVNEHIRKNNISSAFNLEHFYKIQFKNIEYLKEQLTNKLLEYFNYYQIKKGV